jgi:hypothetical protein
MMFLPGCGLLARNPFLFVLKPIFVYNQIIKKRPFRRLFVLFLGGKFALGCFVSMFNGSWITRNNKSLQIV